MKITPFISQETRVSSLCFLLLFFISACSAPQPEVEVRLANQSNQRLTNIRIQFPEGEVSLGDMLPHTNSDYQLQKGIFASVPLTFSTNDGDYQYEATISDADEPLAAGKYSYALQIVNDKVQQVVLDDNSPHSDSELVGYWLWTETVHANGDTSVPVSNGVEPSGILFTGSTSLNAALDGALFGAYSGCNSAGGSFFTTPEQALVMHLVTFSGDECRDEIDSAEKLILQAIDGITTYEVAGNTLKISLTNGDTLIFDRS